MERREKQPDGASSYPADAHDLQGYRDAAQALSRMQVPILFHAADPRERLFVAAFDGTGNSLYKDPVEKRTNVAIAYLQLEHSKAHNVRAGYVEGPGTQEGFITRTRDLISGGTFEARAEEMYKQFITQAAKWVRQDPQVRIRVAGIGFSRGAEEEAFFVRLNAVSRIQSMRITPWTTMTTSPTSNTPSRRWSPRAGSCKPSGCSIPSPPASRRATTAACPLR
jgi:hypothetical protein